MFLFAAAALWVGHIYTEGKYIKVLLSYKKYYQMAAVVLGFLFFYWVYKKFPGKTQELLLSTNEYIKYLPLDRNVKSLIHPYLDLTSKSRAPPPVFTSTAYQPAAPAPVKNKRSVTDSKKKFVASKQGWKCRQCYEILPATFEVDHIRRLQHGGSNEIDNLQALCPNCHRNKTMMETMTGESGGDL